ncbi:hypothetical protein Q4503_11110 [Colwellia sp. 6_MG-2023]|uniref:hypothetical protein n=1 Tax=Colwellia sp. 6_MG-2023 TaxID=3062676 RepID=UPI0026E3E3F0|nr:hypothetical protein [Colwellia sp. 6_MG-2023]MDO6488253.1 hypothetical protein [Colwellia sp. 6_MG-2023]
MEDEKLERIRVRGTKFYKDQHGKYWIRRAGNFKETDEKPYIEDYSLSATTKPNKTNKIVTCKKCFQVVTPNIAKCPHCDVSNPADSIKVQMITGAIALIVVLLVLFGFRSCSDNLAEKAKTKEPTSSYAFVYCMEFVEARLKVPSSADFSSLSNSNVTQLKKTRRGGKDEIKYLVTGYVDAKNSFNAKIRNNYACTVTGKTGGEWVLNDISMQ